MLYRAATNRYPVATMDRTCEKCGKSFSKPYFLQRHRKRKTPCDPIIQQEDHIGPECRYCGRAFTTKQAMSRHVRKSCKIAGSEEGMEKLMTFTMQRQIAELKAQTAKQAEEHAKQAEEHSKQMAEIAAMMKQMMSGQLTTLPEQKEAPTAEQTLVQAQDQGVGINNGVVVQNTNNITFNIFGAENIDHVTRARIAEILAPLKQFSASDAAIQALLQTALLIYSDPEHPENITCYMPNKKTKEALVYKDAGWEVQPVSLVLPPIMQKSVDLLFDKQPIEGVGDTPVGTDMDACGDILKVLQEFEKDPKRAKQIAGTDGSLRAVLIRNKGQLARILEKPPEPGTTN